MICCVNLPLCFLGNKVTFWTNVKQSTNKHNTSIIEYSQTPPTLNTKTVTYSSVSLFMSTSQTNIGRSFSFSEMSKNHSLAMKG